MPKIFTSETESTFLNDICIKTKTIFNVYDDNFNPILAAANRLIEEINDPQKLYAFHAEGNIDTSPFFIAQQQEGIVPEVACSGQLVGNGEYI